MDVHLPNNWSPRVYQQPLWKYLIRGGKRAYSVWHRRSGKDDVGMHFTATAAVQRVANYWYLLPVSTQGRKAIWDAVNPHTGKKRIDEAFPRTLRRRTIEDEMKIELINGSFWQVLGSDNYNSYMGSPPAGVVFSEWALADPQAWPYIQPMLEENGGWASFNTTPRGRNHAADFYEMAKENEDWFCEKLGADVTGVFSQAQLDNIRRELIQIFGHQEGNARFQQEYYCSFDAALPGAYYGQEMNDAEKEGRIAGVPYDPAHLVFPCFDFGRGQSNATAIVFMQLVGLEPRCIDYHEDNTGKIEGFGKLLREKPYTYGSLILPHDAKPERLATGVSYEEQFRQMGFRTRCLTQATEIGPEINIARQFITMAWFDKKKCSRLIECLRSYHREWDSVKKVFRGTPRHDWASHGADSWRYAAVAHKLGLFSRDETPDMDTDYSHDFDNADRSSISGY